MTSIEEFATKLTRTLANGVTGTGRIRDPVNGALIPLSQYANTCFATAAFRVAAKIGNKALSETGLKALSCYLDAPQATRGHEEFNSFAILEAIKDVQAGKYNLSVERKELLEAVEYRSKPNTHQGNNWLLLQAVCRLERQKYDPSVLNQIKTTRILRLADRWEQSGGILADVPRYPLGPVETPLTYHAKMTYAYGRIAAIDAGYWDVFRSGLRVLDELLLPSGECLYFGRSENTLFGYASAIAATDLYLTRYEATWVEELRSALCNYVIENFDPTTGRTIPSSGGQEGGIRDDYVIDGVYAAYSAMLLAGVSDSKSDGRRNADKRITKGSHGFAAGLRSVIGSSSALGIAKTGQVKYIDRVIDGRYSGLVPNTFTYNKSPVCPGFPERKNETGRRFEPFLPTVSIYGNMYRPATWKTESQENKTKLSLRGEAIFHPTRLPSKPDCGDNDDYNKSKSVLVSVANRTRADHLYDWFKKRPSSLDTRVIRGIHYLKKDNILIIQTVAVIQSDSTESFWQTPYIVTPVFENQVKYELIPDQNIISRSVETPKGAAILSHPEQEVTTSGITGSTIVFDPGENVVDWEAKVQNDNAYVVIETKKNKQFSLRTGLHRRTQSRYKSMLSINDYW